MARRPVPIKPSYLTAIFDIDLMSIELINHELKCYKELQRGGTVRSFGLFLVLLT